MKNITLSLLIISLAGCGYSSSQNELTGQIKKVTHETPLVCPNRVDADISLGVMRGGVGSVSSQDIWVTVPNPADQKTLKEAAETGEIVKVTYDVARWVWCCNDHIVSHAEIVE